MGLMVWRVGVVGRQVWMFWNCPLDCLMQVLRLVKRVKALMRVV